MATEGAADDADVLASFVDELGQRIGSAQEKWAELQKIAEEKGIDLTGLKEDTTQQSASRGYQNLSEDTGGELVGRAIAQYESNLRIEASVREAKEIAEIMAAGQVQIKDIAAESRALIADSYLELQQKRENTGAIIKPIKNLSDKIDNWDSKIMSL
jgi:PHP family Zn ribbon phosphoesterase